MSSDLTSKIHQIEVSPGPSEYEFEGFRLDADHLLLYRDGLQLPLTPKQVLTLLALVELGGQVVAKNVLMNRLWGDTAVEESNLIQNIYVLRKTLGETSTGRPMIETLRRRGYRFNGDLKKSADGRDVAGARERDGDPPVRLLSTRRAYVVAALLILAAFAVGYVVYTRVIAPNARKRAIAVLPLKPIDAATPNELYSIGIADALINRLSTIEGLTVRPLSATRGYTSPDQDPVGAGLEQKVDFVLVGSYQAADGKVRVTSQLINVITGQIENPYKFESELASIFVIQDGVAEEVAAQLTSKFRTKGTDRPRVRGTSNEEAYRSYLQGMYIFDRREQGYAERSIEKFDRALAIDPNYARAWSAKALAYRARAYSDKADPAGDYRNASEAVDRALALDPGLPEAHAVRCDNKMAFEYDFTGAEAECLKAIELDPDSAAAREGYAALLSSRGRHDEALREIKTAIDLNPTSYLYQRTMGNVLYLARRYREAKAQFERLLEMNANAAPTYQWMIRTLEASGDEAGAFDWFLRSLKAAKADAGTIQRYESIFANEGWTGVLRERSRRASADGVNFLRVAGWAARTGDHDTAFRLLEEGFERRASLMIFLKVEPQLDPIRNDPRYANLPVRFERR